MRWFKFKAIWFVCLLAFASALTINQLNLNQLSNEDKRQGKTIITNDDPSYLRPAENYIKTGEWKDNSLGTQSYFTRPPGYGILYFTCLKIAGKDGALSLLKTIQLILFSLSVYWLFYISQQLFKSKKVPYYIAIIYGIIPLASNFIFYTLSEAISPALLLYYVYLLFKADFTNVLKTKRVYFLIAALVFAFLIIVRPQVGLFGLLLPVFLLKNYLKYGVKKLLLKLVFFCLIAFSFTLVWQIRNYNLTGKYVGLHAIYHEDGNSMFRPTLEAYWNFVGGWAQEGQTAYSYMVPMWQGAIKGDVSETYIETAINTFPKKVVNYFGKDRLTEVFKKYQESILFQKQYYDQNLAMPNDIPNIELEVIKEFDQLTSEFKSKFWMDYYFVSPAKVFKTIAFHSNLSLHIFQNTYRGNIFVESLRYFCFAIHSLCFIMLIISLFIIKQTDWRLGFINLICFSYVFYLCFFQRGIEERYTLPLLSLLIISLFNGWDIFWRKLRS